MKTRIVLSLLLTVAAAAFARPPMGPGMHPHRFPIERTYLRAELDSLAGEEAELGSLSYGELREQAGRLSVALQKDRFVARSKAMSYMLPGSGQLLNKEYGSGAAFLATDLVLGVGTLVGTYFLLPADLRFNELNYFDTPFNVIRDTWEGHTFMDYLPSMALMAGGAVLRAILGQFSAAHAEKLARRNIDGGKIDFTPDLLLQPGGGMMMGLGWRY